MMIANLMNRFLLLTLFSTLTACVFCKDAGATGTVAGGNANSPLPIVATPRARIAQKQALVGRQLGAGGYSNESLAMNALEQSIISAQLVAGGYFSATAPGTTGPLPTSSAPPDVNALDQDIISAQLVAGGYFSATAPGTTGPLPTSSAPPGVNALDQDIISAQLVAGGYFSDTAPGTAANNQQTTPTASASSPSSSATSGAGASNGNSGGGVGVGIPNPFGSPGGGSGGGGGSGDGSGDEDEQTTGYRATSATGFSSAVLSSSGALPTSTETLNWTIPSPTIDIAGIASAASLVSSALAAAQGPGPTFSSSGAVSSTPSPPTTFAPSSTPLVADTGNATVEIISLPPTTDRPQLPLGPICKGLKGDDSLPNNCPATLLNSVLP